MVIEEVTFKTARPEEGMVLLKYGTNGEPLIARNQVLNSQGDWTEIPIEEGEKILAEWQVKQEQLMKEELYESKEY